ncbi:hypothetical protein LINPERHAP2_LOCUS14540 [Linum perenne]
MYSDIFEDCNFYPNKQQRGYPPTCYFSLGVPGVMFLALGS